MAPSNGVPKPPTSPRPPETAPHSPQQFLELLKVAQANHTLPGPATQSAKNEGPSGDDQGVMTGASKVEARASKLESKTVQEIWDKAAHRYKVVESISAQPVDELDEYIFIVRSRVDRYTLEETFFIDVKSHRLRDVLRSVLQDVNGVSLREDKPALERNILYHYLDELEAHQKKMSHEHSNNLTSLQHLGLLIDHIRKDHAVTTNHLVSLLDNGEITYDLLWALYKPNTVVYTTCVGTAKPRCVVFDYGEERTTHGNTKYYNMICRYLDYDGSVFGETSIELGINKFRGAKRISSLNAFPLRYHLDESTVKTSILESGRNFISLMGAHHRYCQGAAFAYDEKGQVVKFSVDSRIMVDAAFFQKMNPNYSRPHVGEAQNNKSSYFDFYSGLSDTTSSGRIKKADIKPKEMNERELLICCPTVLGFSLGDKIWGEFAVADIEEIEWSSSPFDCLIIPDEYRNVLMALVESHMRQVSGVSFDDFVAGKGRGLNVLLHGPPGFGKTLTAEAVSEHLRRPLYSISAGEMPLNAAGLEVQLSRIFDTTVHWGALLLLDEADVFLERRSSQDLVRNSLVAVFLRRLEYCQGIMFMTSNRASEFDEAALSRIHLMLRYGNLDLQAKTEIWRNFLNMANTSQGKAIVSDKEFERLVSTKFNGRQVKNIVATAHALATKDDTQLSFSHLQQAVKANEKFIREFTNADHIDRMFS